MTSELVPPEYAGPNIVNVPGALQTLLLDMDTIHPFTNQFFAAGLEAGSGVKNVVLLIVDGLGYGVLDELLPDVAIIPDMLGNGTINPIDSIFPTTTAAGITALACGKSPKAHGLLEWIIYSKKLDARIHSVLFKRFESKLRDSLADEKISIKYLLSQPTLARWCADNAISHFTHVSHAISPSKFSEAVYPGTKPIRFQNSSDMSVNLRRTFANKAWPDKSLHVVYWGDYDSIAHEHGPTSEQALEDLRQLFRILYDNWIKLMDRRLAAETALLIVADHGQIDVNPETVTYLKRHKKIKALLKRHADGKTPILPWGSPRDVFLAVQKDKIPEMKKLLARMFGDKADIIESRYALEQGWFGAEPSMHKEFLSRIGDLIILPRDDAMVWWEDVPTTHFKGMHGGLSDAERIVPFGTVRVSDLLDGR